MELYNNRILDIISGIYLHPNIVKDIDKILRNIMEIEVIDRYKKKDYMDHHKNTNFGNAKINFGEPWGVNFDAKNYYMVQGSKGEYEVELYYNSDVYPYYLFTSSESKIPEKFIKVSYKDLIDKMQNIPMMQNLLLENRDNELLDMHKFLLGFEYFLSNYVLYYYRSEKVEHKFSLSFVMAFMGELEGGFFRYCMEEKSKDEIMRDYYLLEVLMNSLEESRYIEISKKMGIDIVKKYLLEKNNNMKNAKNIYEYYHRYLM